jgi:putative tricarboxylic transport membrane protein
MRSQAERTPVTDAPAESPVRGRLLVATPGALGVVVGLAAWVMSSGLHPDDQGYPRVLATVLLVLGVWNIVADLRARAVEGVVDEDYGTLATGRVISFALLVAVCIWLVTPLGFYPAAAGVIVGGMVIMGVRRPLLLIGYPVLLLAVGYLLFSVLLGVPLPLARGF